jgi:hypothetical protein
MRHCNCIHRCAAAAGHVQAGGRKRAAAAAAAARCVSCAFPVGDAQSCGSTTKISLGEAQVRCWVTFTGGRRRRCGACCRCGPTVRLPNAAGGTAATSRWLARLEGARYGPMLTLPPHPKIVAERGSTPLANLKGK